MPALPPFRHDAGEDLDIWGPAPGQHPPGETEAGSRNRAQGLSGPREGDPQPKVTEGQGPSPQATCVWGVEREGPGTF